MPWSLSLAWAEAGRSVEATDSVLEKLTLVRRAGVCRISLVRGVPAFPMPAAAACDESVRVTFSTLAFAVELDNDGLGACSGRSLPKFFDGIGSFWFVSEMFDAS